MSMYADEIRNMTDQEILDLLEEAKEELFNLRFQLASGQLENYSRIRVVRKNVARLKTVLRQRQLAAEILQEEAQENA